MQKTYEKTSDSCSIEVEKVFWNYLKKASLLCWMRKLINIPIAVIIARLTALVVADATEGKIQKVFFRGIILLVAAIGTKIFNIITEITYEKLVSKSCHNCKMELYRRFFMSPLHELYASRHGDILEKFHDDFDTMTRRYLSLYPEFWTSIITVAAYFILLFHEQKMLALIFLGISILQIIPPMVVKKYFQINYDANREVEAKLTDFICSGYRGFETIKLYGLKAWFLESLKKLHQQTLRVGNKSEATCTIEHMMDEFIGKILTYGSYIIVGVFVLYKMMLLEVGIQAIALAPGLFGAVGTIFAQLPRFAETRAAQKRLAKWFTERFNKEHKTENEKIILTDVSYAFGDKKILEHVSVQMDMNQIHVLKGENGIGKSTLFHLILGLLLCERGKISVANDSSEFLSDKNFPEKIFYLPQEDAEFELSPDELYQMIGKEQMETIKNLAREFGLKDCLLSETKISELSGGERKKVFLSLAFGINPKILLLDEPTNSLDEAGKNTLQQLLRERLGGTIIITHENWLDHIADCIYTLKNGGLSCEKPR